MQTEVSLYVVSRVRFDFSSQVIRILTTEAEAEQFCISKNGEAGWNCYYWNQSPCSAEKLKLFTQYLDSESLVPSD